MKDRKLEYKANIVKAKFDNQQSQVVELINELVEKIEQLEGAPDVTSKKIEHMEEKIDDLEDEKEELKDRINELEKQLEDLNS